MNSCKITFFSVLFLLVAPILNAQVNEPTPLSPQIAAFQQYGDINVNLSTGVPNISIPLLEINHFGYKLPLSLDYFPTPLKPGYNYDVTGVGWNLSLRSHISRKVNYLPDEYKDFVVFEMLVMDFASTYSLDMLNTENFAPDLFNVSLPDGSSFKFYIRRESETSDPEVFILNGRPLKVTWEKSSRFKEGIISIQITDESGIKYSFNQTNYRFRSDQENYHTEWHLTEIKLPQYSEAINFFYRDAVKATHRTPVVGYSWERSFGQAKIPNLNGTATLDHGIMLLSSIVYNGGSVKFDYQEDTPSLFDLIQKPNYSNYLEAIEHGAGCTFKDYIVFNRKINNVNDVSIAQLESIEFKEGKDSCENNDVIKKYEFENEDISVRSRTDHWGYCNSNGHPSVNGVSNFVFYSPEDHENFANTNYLTKIADGYHDDVNIDQYAKYKFNQGNSKAGKPGGKHGILKSITYPTGGKTEFDFERHKFLTKSGTDGEFIFNDKELEVAEASGFRVKSIKNLDSNGEEINTKSYRYGKRASEIWGVSDETEMLDNSSVVDVFMRGRKPESHTDVGVVVVDPNILNFLNYQVVFPSSNPVLIRDGFFFDTPRLGPKISGIKRFFALLFGSTLAVSKAIPIATPKELIVKNYLKVILGTKFSKFFYSDIDNKYHANVNISASNFQKLLNGRPQVVYPYVTVYEGVYSDNDPSSTSGINGKTEFIYDFMDESDDDSGMKFFMEPVMITDYEAEHYTSRFESSIGYYESKTHRYNKLLEKRDYAVLNSNSYRLVREEFNTWGYSSSWSDDLFDVFKAPFPLTYVNQATENSPGHQTSIYEYISQGTRNNIYQEFYDPKLNSIRTINHYSDDTNITSKQSWSYLPGGMISKEYTTNSKGELKKVNYKYSSEFEEENILNLPINVLTYFDDGFDDQSLKYRYRLISGMKTDYFSTGRPEKIYTLELDGAETSLCDSITPCNFKHEATYSYNSDALTQISYKEGSSNTVFLWNSIRQLVIAKIENTTYAEVSSLDGKPDSYNSKTYYDELQLLVSNDALITTYTYNSTGNITQQTDPRGYTTYYEYDNFNRLKAVKDADGNILSENEYNYKQ